MKIRVNKVIPFRGFIAMTFYNTIFWRKEYKFLLNIPSYFDVVYNHESIHEAQMRDFCKWLPIGGTIFYIVYLLEWCFRLLFTSDFMSKKAYKHLSFEVEAKNNERNLKYLQQRKRFAQWR